VAGIDHHSACARGVRQVHGLIVDSGDAIQHQRLVVEVAAFETWDTRGRSFDAVISGQSWHWIDPVGGAAKAARVLRPGRRVAVFWNVFESPPDMAAAFAAVYRDVLPAGTRNPWTLSAIAGYERFFTTAADGMRQAGDFDGPERWRFEWERDYSRDEWSDQLRTGGDTSQYSPEMLETLVAGVGAAIDKRGGSFTMGYATVVVTGIRGTSL
jgi:SAM-dependent methyltransferase